MKSGRVGQTEPKVVQRGQGSPLLFVHAFPLDHSMWSAQIERFSNHWHVIAPDLRGPGAVEFARERILMAPPDGVAAALRGIADRPDMTGFLSQIQVPTLL